jgi:hypothetical protein
MPVLIALPMYPVSEVCRKLAEIKQRNKDYDRQFVDALIAKELPTAQKVGNRYMLTDIEVEWLATRIRRVNKKRQKIIDKRQ